MGIITVGTVLAGITACNKVEEVVTVKQNLEIKMDIRQKAATDPSKPMVWPIEREIESLQILVFNYAGKIEAYYNSADLSNGLDINQPITMSILTGSKTIVALANFDDMRAIRSYDELLSTPFELADNDINNNRKLLMSGITKCVLNASAPTSVNISLERMVSRIVLRQLYNALPLMYKNMTIQSVMLTNVPLNAHIVNNMYETDVLLNYSGRDDYGYEIIDGDYALAYAPGITFKMVNKIVQCHNGYDFSNTVNLYTYPNTITIDTQGDIETYLPKKTRLVITAIIDNVKCYYPITLDELEPNVSYYIDVIIRSPGVSDPEEPLSKDPIQITLESKPYSTGYDYIENI